MIPRNPIIVIGAGRSGTTLLGRMLGGHPEIDFKGETAFLSARLWLETWGDRFWLNWQHYNRQQPRSSCEPMPAIPDDLLASERARVGRAVASLVATVLDIDSSRRHWGFKEIWNGLASRTYPWADYDAIYPGAFWLHLVRHPVDFARSCAQWSRQPLTAPFLEGQLRAWVEMVRYNRGRAETGRYVELRYEDLRAAPDAALRPVLTCLELAWSEDCLVALGSNDMASRRPANSVAGSARANADELARLVAEIDGLGDLMTAFDYRMPEMVPFDPEPADNDDRPQFCNLHDPFGLAVTDHGPQHALLQRLQLLQSEVERLEAVRRVLSAPQPAPPPQRRLSRAVQRLLGRG